MTVPSCSHGFPSPANCTDCMADGVMVPTQRPQVVHRFIAAYDGHCDRCSDPIRPGEEICLLDDGETYIHAEHAPRERS